MFKNLIILIAIVVLAALLTTSCGSKKDLVLPDDETHRPMFGDAPQPEAPQDGQSQNNQVQGDPKSQTAIPAPTPVR